MIPEFFTKECSLREFFKKAATIVVKTTVKAVGGLYVAEKAVEILEPKADGATPQQMDVILNRPKQPLISNDGGSFLYYATAFPGTAYFLHSGVLSGVVDGKKGITSGWFKTTSTAYQYIFYLDFFTVGVDDSGKIVVRGWNAANTMILSLYSNAAYRNGNWHHFLCSWDLATAGSGKLYIDGVSDCTEQAFINDTIYYTEPINPGLGGDGGSSNFVGSLSELYCNFAEFVSVVSLLSIFRDGVHPKSIGSDGSLVTGTSPALYFRNSYSSFGTNSGTGGNFAKTGTVTDDASLP